MSGIHLFTASLKKLPSLSPDGAAGWVQIRREPKATNEVCREAMGGLSQPEQAQPGFPGE
jgi:hypothetical protein